MLERFREIASKEHKGTGLQRCCIFPSANRAALEHYLPLKKTLINVAEHLDSEHLDR